MKTVLKRGKTVVKKFSCKHCGCVFEADETDYIGRTFGGLVSEPEYESFCPCCGFVAFEIREHTTE